MRSAAAVVHAGAMLCGSVTAVAALGQTLPDAITVKIIAEVETRVSVNGREVTKLAPAERLTPGDEVIYTLEIRNSGNAPVRTLAVPCAIPNHMRYVADSAVGPGADVSYSVDGGRTFAWPDDLTVEGPQGVPRPATAADYTQILWRLKHGLKGHAVAYAHFRAIVK